MLPLPEAASSAKRLLQAVALGPYFEAVIKNEVAE
jgi:hypothetical protein